MKKLFLIFICSSLSVLSSIADPPPPPDGGSTGNSGTSGSPVGAPIDGGLGILLALGAAYGGWKIYLVRKKEKEEPE